MAELIVPDVRVRESFLAAMAEFAAEGRGRPEDPTMIGEDIRSLGSGEGFAAYVQRIRDEALEETPRRPGWVPCTTLWLAEGDRYLGRIAIRHRLTPALTELGGHIGYDVRPSARRRGYATAMLRDALPIANRLGIDPALLTCDPDNTASRKVIEHHGGVLQDELNGKLRFWVPTTRQPADG
jgi:predicted acetyltransferase